MEFLVTMTTQVPEGTPVDAVDSIRAREATRARDLATEGHLLRLWRPPLQPGEWRTLGLFEAEDEVELDKVLASMPLRVWRTDEAQALPAHRNDPVALGLPIGTPAAGGTEYLVTMTVTVPAGTPLAEVEETYAREAQRAAELAAQGHLRRLWALPTSAEGAPRALGLWRARDEAEMHAIIGGLPLAAWISSEITPLSEHPNDPGTATPPSPAR